MCDDNYETIVFHRRYLTWDMWKEINSHRKWSESDLYCRELQSGIEMVKKMIPEKLHEFIRSNIDNYRVHNGQPEKTVSFDFYLDLA